MIPTAGPVAALNHVVGTEVAVPTVFAALVTLLAVDVKLALTVPLGSTVR